MGAKIEGKGRVFAKEHDGWTSYTLGISSKKQDGTWAKAYQPIRFKKDDVPPPNATDIDYVAFPIVKERQVDGQNRNYIVWQILSWAVAEAEQAAQSENPMHTGFTALESGDIPF